MVRNTQEEAHPRDFDYAEGSPHLKHPQLLTWIERSLHALVQRQIAGSGECRVLEVGAGHGGFTRVLVEAGASVTVTEMSEPSADRIRSRFADRPEVTVVYDPEATWASTTQDRFDAVVCISVLHHIPDYCAFLDTTAQLIRPGGFFVSWQDPTWYPRRTTLTHQSEKAFYYLWRIRQGDLKAGLNTRWRRLRGVYDETLSADMSEYHVVRNGVDELLLKERAERYFNEVEVDYYWSSHSTLGQRLGEKRTLPNTFSLMARDRRDDTGVA